MKISYSRALKSALMVLALFIAPSLSLFAITVKDNPVNLVCAVDNDLYQVLIKNKVACKRYDNPHKAIEALPAGSGLMILADNYPSAPTQVDASLFAAAAKKNIRLYVEFPSMLPGIEIGDKAYIAKGRYRAVYERVVASSDFFNPGLPKLGILELKDCHYLPIDAKDPHLVLTRVEGYNTAVYGITEEAHPLLFEHPNGNVLVGTTKLSQFVRGRYAPYDAWQHVATTLVKWATRNNSLPLLEWTPTVRPMFTSATRLPKNAKTIAIKRGVDYYEKSNLFLNPDWPKLRVSWESDSLPRKWKPGDGTHGIGECYISKMIFHNGRQAVSREAHHDCNLEAAMGLACGVALFNDRSHMDKIRKMSDFVFRNSALAQGNRANPRAASYGIVGWNTSNPESYWGDDNARAMISAIAVSGLTQDSSWDEFIVRTILANFRTTGRYGYRPSNMQEKQLEEKGWEHYFKSDFVFLNPHMQAYPWVTYLWLYSKTGYKPLLERTKKGFEMMMEAYPDWKLEANRYEQERCRMLLPLAWLVRVEDTPRHRAWLDTIAQYVIKLQDKSGAIPQIPEHIVASNKGYGSGECAIVHKAGDPATDALYSLNFAFIGMHEAAAVTGNQAYAESADKMADFFVRTQTQSQRHPELDGTWYRGFDFQKWDYWGSDGDWGWGVWTNEIGWTHSWIVTTLALQEMKTSLWDVASKVDVSPYFNRYREIMLPDAVVGE